MHAAGGIDVSGDSEGRKTVKQGLGPGPSDERLCTAYHAAALRSALCPPSADYTHCAVDSLHISHTGSNINRLIPPVSLCPLCAVHLALPSLHCSPHTVHLTPSVHVAPSILHCPSSYHLPQVVSPTFSLFSALSGYNYHNVKGPLQVRHR